jgi:hypothetical protein
MISAVICDQFERANRLTSLPAITGLPVQTLKELFMWVSGMDGNCHRVLWTVSDTLGTHLIFINVTESRC